MSHVYHHQSDTIEGRLVLPASSDLSAITAPRLVALVSDSGVAKVDLPDALTDDLPYLLLEGAAADAGATVEPLSPDRQIRVEAKDAMAPGDIAVMADPSTAADKGKVRKLPEAAGTYIQVGIAEATAAAGDWALIRPIGWGRRITVSE